MSRKMTFASVFILILILLISVFTYVRYAKNSNQKSKTEITNNTPNQITKTTPAEITKVSPAQTQASPQNSKPNILVITGDDIGYFNPSIYHRGIMGYKTPNIDRIANEGVLFTDSYGQQSCTAGRSAIITGQSPIRTGLTKVGLPGSPLGLSKSDPTIAELLKPLGYTSGQFGKNHLGDRDEFLPTNHGFDEFYGNLYHLNAEEEPENEDYPKDPNFKKKYGPRGIIHSYADGRIENTGPLTKKRMETVDDEFTDQAIKFIEQAVKDGKPFFVWYNPTRMHIWTHLKEEYKGKTGYGIYADGMVEHDALIGRILKKLDELGIMDNTIVVYNTDNGSETFSWPDGGTTIFRGEKATNWEGGYRIPSLIRWQGVIKPGTIDNSIFSLEDLLPTFLAAAGDPDIKEKLLKGYDVNNTNYKVHLDGYNMLPYFKGEVSQSPRQEFLYWSDDGDLVALRFGDWKAVFQEQREEGFKVWSEPFVKLRLPKIFNLRSDPFERADRDSIFYAKWLIDHAFLMVPAQDYVATWISSFKEFPPRQKPASFSIDQVMNLLNQTAND